MPSPGRPSSRWASSESVGLITLDAHLDMRDLDQGLSNGNPVRALMEDGLPGANIAQVGLASFANTQAMHRDALAAGNCLVSMADIRRDGIEAAIDRALDHVGHCEAILVDCDIDVIDRAQMPGAPGARPGGMAVEDFFWAVRDARRRAAGQGDRPYRMGPAARCDRPLARSPPRAGSRNASRATRAAEPRRFAGLCRTSAEGD